MKFYKLKELCESYKNDVAKRDVSYEYMQLIMYQMGLLDLGGMIKEVDKNLGLICYINDEIYITEKCFDRVVNRELNIWFRKVYANVKK